jgi:hypothetical protein
MTKKILNRGYTAWLSMNIREMYRPGELIRLEDVVKRSKKEWPNINSATACASLRDIIRKYPQVDLRPTGGEKSGVYELRGEPEVEEIEPTTKELIDVTFEAFSRLVVRTNELAAFRAKFEDLFVREEK